MEIPILNIYYMLCYAWNRLEEGDCIDVNQIDRDNAAQLFAKVIIDGTTHLLKKGLDRGYVLHNEEMSRVRGRIDFPENIKRNFFKQPRLYCNFDELSHDILHNQILKATIRNMLGWEYWNDNSPKVKEAKEQLRNIYLRFHQVGEISLNKKCFRRVQLNRNNFFYDFLMRVCELIYDDWLISKGKGGNFKDLKRNKMPMVFEEFLRNFYRRHLPEYSTGRQEIKWQLTTESEQAKNQNYVPKMQTDITLKGNNRKIIIDAKYYLGTLAKNTQFGSIKIHPSHLYQLFAYLMNQEKQGKEDTLNCEGILLYPAVDADYDLRYMHDNHKISIRTINLNQDWQYIERDLVSIIR